MQIGVHLKLSNSARTPKVATTANYHPKGVSMIEIIRALTRPIITLICILTLSWLAIHGVYPDSAEELILYGVFTTPILWWFRDRTGEHKNGNTTATPKT